jgi:4-diphosphocytidyl-2-C-methyl-D-erythritol kinase
MTITEFAAAKVNLTLRVLGRRPDGYHELESLIAFADVGDQISLEPSASFTVATKGPFASAIGGGNIVATALELLHEREPRLMLGSVLVDKQLPVAAGLGGGSADAAALLRCVARANPDLAERVDWGAIAAAIGADVSVCLQSRPAFITGVGEQVESISRFPQLAVLLVNPGVPLPTAAVFEALRAGPAAAETSARRTPGPFSGVGDLLSYMQARGNDLERPATRLLPAIADVLDVLRASSACLFARMTGSGPTCFGVYPSVPAAQAAARIIAASAPAWWVRPARLMS